MAKNREAERQLSTNVSVYINNFNFLSYHNTYALRSLKYLYSKQLLKKTCFHLFSLASNANDLISFQSLLHLQNLSISAIKGGHVEAISEGITEVHS